MVESSGDPEAEEGAPLQTPASTSAISTISGVEQTTLVQNEEEAFALEPLDITNVPGKVSVGVGCVPGMVSAAHSHAHVYARTHSLTHSLTHSHTHTHTHTHTHIHTHTHTHTHRNTQRNTHTHTQRIEQSYRSS